MLEFSQKTIEELQFYVYVLIDPRTGKIFYVGKGTHNRVFEHVRGAIDGDHDSDKLNTIREIQQAGEKVRHFIVRHKLTSDNAFLVESVLIDFLTHESFSFVSKITNLVAGHHQWNEGIKTAEDLELLYACKPLEPQMVRHNLLTINVNRTYKLKNERHPNIYEATRKSWVISKARLGSIDYVASEYRGIIRAVFKPTKWLPDGNRWMFEGEEVKSQEILDLYLNKSVPPKLKGSANPIKYLAPIS